jgi:hypothetical protein
VLFESVFLKGFKCEDEEQEEEEEEMGTNLVEDGLEETERIDRFILLNVLIRAELNDVS